MPSKVTPANVPAAGVVVPGADGGGGEPGGAGVDLGCPGAEEKQEVLPLTLAGTIHAHERLQSVSQWKGFVQSDAAGSPGSLNYECSVP